eukprot:TRINITY_DN1312_c0_g1_i2.p2 TRINITY_DN1312_c0_g1~~TRINITY_DN1312_c0_g1_i2.p2  ORF type:complete len:402 (+),score=143.80 TRINITY_DN1312_c0_g1_i2:1615-2820(+)
MLIFVGSTAAVEFIFELLRCFRDKPEKEKSGENKGDESDSEEEGEGSDDNSDEGTGATKEANDDSDDELDELDNLEEEEEEDDADEVEEDENDEFFGKSAKSLLRKQKRMLKEASDEARERNGARVRDDDRKKGGRASSGLPKFFTAPETKQQDFLRATKQKLFDVKLYKLHGNMAQNERVESYRKFRKSTDGVLICTDVAARGLDMPGIEWVVQYDPPTEVTEYVHRIGRTARLEASGKALMFLLPEERAFVDRLFRLQGVSLFEQTLDSVLNNLNDVPYYNPSLIAPEFIIRQKFQDAVAASPHLLRLATAAFRSAVRAYATHTRATRHIFNIKNLHLGHVAHSFGMVAPPSQLGEVEKGAKQQSFQDRLHKKEKDRVDTIKQKYRKGVNPMAEFSSGL